jgi:two-component system, NarL family, nitrate/nitrite response regulator NarL
MNDHTSSRRWLEAAPALQTHSQVAGGEPPAPVPGYNPTGLNVEASLRRVASRRNGDRAGILIADDHPIFRDGLRKLIESQQGMWVTAESSVSGEVVRLARTLKPQVILLDLGMPRRSSFQVLTELAGLSLPVRTLVMAETVEQSTILEALYLGAYGIVLKGSPREVLLKSICSVIEGQYWLDNASVPIVIEALRKGSTSPNAASGGRDFGLTPQELKIVGTVANGSSNKEVSQAFNISERTVKHHLTNVFNKLGLSSRLELAVFALEHGLANKR